MTRGKKKLQELNRDDNVVLKYSRLKFKLIRSFNIYILIDYNSKNGTFYINIALNTNSRISQLFWKENNNIAPKRSISVKLYNKWAAKINFIYNRNQWKCLSFPTSFLKHREFYLQILQNAYKEFKRMKQFYYWLRFRNCKVRVNPISKFAVPLPIGQHAC